MDLEINVEIPGVDTEGQEKPQVVVIVDTKNPPEPHPKE